MDLPFELHIAIRYLLAKRKQAFISVISLISKLGVGVGDSVSVLTPQGTLSPMGMIPHTRRLKVVGIFSLGLYEFDSIYGFVSLDVAKRLFDRQFIDYIQLRIDDIYRAPDVSA